MPDLALLLRRATLAATVVLAVVPATAVVAEQPGSTSTSERVDSMACPVDGPASFDDSWGARRSGGRRHQGVDMVAERGTPVLAAHAGDAWFKTTSAGGRSVWLTTPDGDRFFYAHLDTWEGESRFVEQGEVIGYVGSSGNARGPHLHFEVHPGGDPENPFPHTVEACWAPFAATEPSAAARLIAWR